MSIIQAFNYRDQPVRALLVDGVPVFVALDVCSILELNNVGQALAALDDDEKGSIIINDGTPGDPNKAYVSEAGMYALALRSRDSQAKMFQRWVTHQVIPEMSGARATLIASEPASDSPFNSIRRAYDDGAEYWSARDLMPLMGYSAWRNLEVPIARAMSTARNQGQDVESNFARSRNFSGTKPQEDFHLSRFAAYLVAMNGDPNKPEVAAAQAYFAIQTRVAEAAQPAREMSGPELMARALLEAAETMKAVDRKVLELTPKAEAFDSFLSSVGDYSVNEAAKILARDHQINTGEKRLRARLEEWGWLYRHSGVPRAKQAQIDNGRLAEKPTFYFHPETGEKVAKEPQVRITPKGIGSIRAKWMAVAA